MHIVEPVICNGRKTKALLLFCFILMSVLSAHAQKYSKVKISLGTHSLSDISRMGVEVDHGIFEDGNFYTAELSSGDLAILDANNIHYKVLIDDVVKYFLDENRKPSPKSTPPDIAGCRPEVPRLTIPSNWHLGSMGGYFKYEEMLEMLDSMALLYPALITIKKPVSDSILTVEGRPVYMIKISDNPDSNETSEPEVLYTALHHAREPLSMSQLIMYMYYLLENYSSDPQVKNIVDNTQMFFIPCVNPDGYIYNQSTYPNGGGMWRKNRKLNVDLSYGVDLNRNYGKLWGYDDLGSSPNPSSGTFRGTSAFSEPETRMVKEFCESHNFKFVLNYHTSGNDLIYPWGFENQNTPDSLPFRAFAAYFTEENKYKSGTCYEVLHYNANGVCDDWCYGEQSTKNKIYAMTPECGTEFWMPASKITSTCNNLLEQNLKMASLVLDAAGIRDAGDKVIAGSTGHMKFTIQRMGLQNTDTFRVELIPLSSGLTSNPAIRSFAGMALLETRIDSIQYSIDPALVVDRSVRYVLRVSGGSCVETDTIEKVFGDSLVTIWYDNASSLSAWNNLGFDNWELSTDEFVSPPSSFHDSPNGNYFDNSNYIIRSTGAIDLTNTDFAYLEFYAKWNVARGYDYFQVIAVDTPGNTRIPLCGLYTTNDSKENPGEPVYDGIQKTWVREHINLSGMTGKRIKLTFHLVTSYFNRDGFYLDDIRVVTHGGIPVSVTPVQRDISFSIQPNPASNSVNVILNNNPVSQVLYEITDIIGRRIYAEFASDNNKVIDISAWPSGIYVLHLTVDGRKITGKLVVN